MLKKFIMSLLLICSSFVFCQGNTAYKNIEIKQSFSIGGEKSIASNLYLGFLEDVTVGHTGIIYLLDSENKKIFKFNNQGKYIASYSREGEGPGEMIDAHKIEVDNNNNIVIADNGLKRITVFNENGTYLKSFTFNHIIRDFKIDNQGYFIVEVIEHKSEGNDILVRIKLSYYDNNLNFITVLDSTDYYKDRLRLRVKGKNRIIRYPYPNKIIWNILSKGEIITGKMHSKNVKIFKKGKVITEILLPTEEQLLKEMHKTDYFRKNIFLQDDDQWKKDAPDYARDNMVFPKHIPFFDVIIIDEENKRIYFRTLNKQGDFFEYLAFTSEGKFLSKITLQEQYFNEKTIIKDDALYLWNDGLEEYATLIKYDLQQKKE